MGEEKEGKQARRSEIERGSRVWEGRGEREMESHLWPYGLGRLETNRQDWRAPACGEARWVGLGWTSEGGGQNTGAGGVDRQEGGTSPLLALAHICSIQAARFPSLIGPRRLAKSSFPSSPWVGMTYL